MAEASAPKYVDTEHSRIAMISVTSTFHESGIAGEQRPDMVGRPGVNPLRYETTFYISEDEMNAMKHIANTTKINATRNLSIKEGFIHPSDDDTLIFGNHHFKVGDENKKVTTPNKKDMERLKTKISEAQRQSDVVIVSIHAHEMAGEDKAIPAQFLEEASKGCIDAGADAIIGHGPHILRGIEIYKNKPIFYSLGNFIFQNDSVASLPADFYEKFNLDHSHNISDAFDTRSSNDTKGFALNQKFWESVVAEWEMEGDKVTKIKLHPVELGFGSRRHQRG